MAFASAFIGSVGAIGFCLLAALDAAAPCSTRRRIKHSGKNRQIWRLFAPDAGAPRRASSRPRDWLREGVGFRKEITGNSARPFRPRNETAPQLQAVSPSRSCHWDQPPGRPRRTALVTADNEERRLPAPRHDIPAADRWPLCGSKTCRSKGSADRRTVSPGLTVGRPIANTQIC